jgi:drug/metabolite transporter (DMT)-like permease
MFGGVLAPVLLMVGLIATPASTASLLLNIESVLTALIAWTVFRENADVRVFLGMLAIVAGGIVLAVQSAMRTEFPWSALAIAAACLCWAIDNNFTRAVSGGDPVQIAAIKGAFAGTINTGIALSLGYRLPDPTHIAAAAGVGLLGCGVSLVMFVVALRNLGTARTGAYFSTAPFVGAALSLFLLGETPTLAFDIAGLLMALGVWLHVSESHAHVHTHDALPHDHRHRHDAHHQRT